MPDYKKKIREYLDSGNVGFDPNVGLNQSPTNYNEESIGVSMDEYANSAEGMLDLNPNLSSADKTSVVEASRDQEESKFSNYLRGVMDNTLSVVNKAIDALGASNMGVAEATKDTEFTAPTKKTYSEIVANNMAVLEDSKALEGSKKLNKVWNNETGKYETWEENYGKLLQGNNLFGLVDDPIGGNKRLSIDVDGNALTLSDNYVFYSQRDPETGEYVLAKTRFSNKEELAKVGKSVISSWGPKTMNQNVAKAFVSGIANAAVSIPSHFTGAAEAVTDLYEAYVSPFRGGRQYGKSDDTGLTDQLNDYFNNFRDVLSVPASQNAEDNLFSPEALASGVGQGVVSVAESALTGGALRAGLGKLGLGTILTNKLGAEVAQKTFNRVINFGAGSVLNFSEAYESSKQSGLSDENAALFGMAVGAINSLVESEIGSNALMDWATAGGNRSISKAIFADVRKELGEDLSKVTRKQFAEALDKGVTRSTIATIKSSFDDFTSRGVVGKVVEEATEEGLQTLVSKATESLYDATVARDKEIGQGKFGTELFSKDTMLETLQAALIGGIVGGIGGVASKSKSSPSDKGILPYITDGKTEQVRATLGTMFDGGFLTQAQRDIYEERINYLDGVWNNNKSIFSNLSNYDNSSDLKAEAIGLVNGISQLGQDKVELSNKISEVSRDESLSQPAKDARINDIRRQIEDKDLQIEFYNNKLSNYTNQEGSDKVIAAEQTRYLNQDEIDNNEFKDFVITKRAQKLTIEESRVNDEIKMLESEKEALGSKGIDARFLDNQIERLKNSLDLINDTRKKLATDMAANNAEGIRLKSKEYQDSLVAEEAVEVVETPSFDNTPAPVPNINNPTTVLNLPNEANISKVDRIKAQIAEIDSTLESEDLDSSTIEQIMSTRDQLEEALIEAENELVEKPEEDIEFVAATTNGLAAIQSSDVSPAIKLGQLTKLAQELVNKGKANQKLGKPNNSEFRPLYDSIQAEITAIKKVIAIDTQRKQQEAAAEKARVAEEKIKAVEDKGNAFEAPNRFSVVYRPKALDNDPTAYTSTEVNQILRDTPIDQLISGIEIVFQPIESLGEPFKAGRVQASTKNSNTKLVDPKFNAVVWYNGKKLGLLPESDKFRINGVAIDWETMTEANFRKYLSTTADFELTRTLALNLAKIEALGTNITPELFEALGGKITITNAGVAVEGSIGDRLRIDAIKEANIPGVGYYIYDRTTSSYIGNPSVDMIYADGVPPIPNVSERYVVLTQLGNGQYKWVTAQQPMLSANERTELFNFIKMAKETIKVDPSKNTLTKLNQILNNKVFIAGQEGEQNELVITSKGNVLLQTKKGDVKTTKEVNKISDLDIKTLRKPLTKNPDLKEAMNSLVVNVTAEIVKNPQLNITFDRDKINEYLRNNTTIEEELDPFAGIDSNQQVESTVVPDKIEVAVDTTVLNNFDEFKNLSDSLKQAITKEIGEGMDLANGTRVQKTKFKQLVNAAIAKINPSAEPTFSISPTSTEDTIKLDKSVEWISKNLPNSISIRDLDTLIGNIKNNGVTWGAFYDNAIYLAKNAAKGTEYHEAFHAVFRLMLNPTQIRALLNIAKSKYGIPSKETLDNFRAQSSTYSNMTQKELLDLWLEERMANDFKQYALGKNEGSKFKVAWNKIVTFIKSIVGRQDELEALFSGINSGKFSNSKIQLNDRLPAYSIYTKGIDVEGNIVYTSQKEARVLSTTIAALTQKKMQDSGLSFNAALDEAIEDQKNLYNLDNSYLSGYAETLSDKDYELFEKKLLDKSSVLLDSANIDKIKDDVRKYFEVFAVETLEDEDNTEDTINEVGERFDVDPWTIGGISSLSQAVRAYIGFATYNTTDEFGQPVELAVDGFTVYKGLTRALAGLDEDKVMERFKFHADFNVEAKAVFDKIVADTGIDINNLNVIPDNDKIRKIVNAFKNESVSWMTILYDSANGKANVIEANRRSAKMIQFNNWANNFFETSLTLSNPNTKKELGKAVSDIKTSSNINDIKSMRELMNISKKIQTDLKKIGMDLSNGYIVYSLVKKQIESDIILPENLVKLYNSYQGAKGLFDNNSEDLTNINIEIQAGYNPYEIVMVDKKERGAVTRLEGLAEANAIFDETVIDSTFQNADGKNVYSILNPSFGLVKLRELKDSTKKAAYLGDQFITPDGLKLNHLLADENSDTIFANLNQAMFDGFRETNLGGENSIEGEGLTYGKFDGKTYLLSDVALFVSNRKNLKLNGVTIGQTAMFNINQMEASNTGYLVSLPVDTHFTKKGIQTKAVEILRDYMAQEFIRINKVRTSKDQIIYKGYNTKPYVDKDGVLQEPRGYNFTEFADIEGTEAFIDLAKKEYATVAEAYEAFNTLANESNLNQSIENKLNRDIDQMLEVYNDYGITESDLPRETIKNISKEYVHKNGLDWRVFVGDMYLNQYINTLGINNLLLGDYAMGIKNTVDWFKRAKGIIGSGKDLGVGITNVAVFKEPTALVDKMLNNIDDDLSDPTRTTLLNELVEKGELSKIDVSDAQSYVTIAHKKLQLQRWGRFSDEIAAIYDKIENGIALSWKEVTVLNDNGAALNSAKTVVYDGKHYLKLSEFPLTPALVGKTDESGNVIMGTLDNGYPFPAESKEGFEYLYNMYKSMVEQGVDQVMPESASKMATKNPAKMSNTGEFDLTQSITPIENRFKRLQVETPSGKTKIKHGTQLIQLVDSEQDDTLAIDFSYNPEIKTLGQLRDHYRSLLADVRVDSFKEALSYVVNEETDETKVNELAKKFYETVEASGGSENQLKFFQPAEDGSRKYDWNLGPIINKAEQLFLAHFSKGVLSQKVPGLKLSLVSDKGIKVKDKETGKMRDLQHMVKDSDDNYYSECMLPAFAEDLLGKDPSDDRIKEVLKMFGIRIPTQDKHSMISLKVVGFLPPEYGAVGVFPKQLVLLSGADFDIDSIYIHRKDYINQDGKLVPTNSENNQMVEAEIKFLTNDFVRNGAALIPATMDSIKSVAKEVNSLLGGNTYSTSPNTPLERFKANRGNSEGKSGIGPVALFNVSNAFLSKAKLPLRGGVTNVIIDGKMASGFDSVLDIDGNRKNDNLSTLLSAMTDNAKEQLASKLNLTEDLLGVASYMLSIGVPMRETMLILNQPIMRTASESVKLGAKFSIGTSAYEEAIATYISKNKISGNIESVIAQYSKSFSVDNLVESIKPKKLADMTIEELVYQVNIGNLVVGLKQQSNYIGNISAILSLNKGLESTFVDNQKFSKALRELQFGMFVPNTYDREEAYKQLEDMNIIKKVGDKYIAGSEYPALFVPRNQENRYPVDARLAIINDPSAYQNILIQNKVINDVAKRFFISETQMFRNLVEGFGSNGKQTQAFLTSYLGARSYEKYLSTNDPAGFEGYTNSYLNYGNLLIDRKNNIGKTLTELKANKSLHKDNKLLRMLRVDKPIKNSKVVNIVFPTRIKDPDLFNQLADDYTSLFLNPDTKQFAIDLYHYVYFKDGLQFKNNSPINIIGSYMFNKYSNALTELNTNLNLNNSNDLFNKPTFTVIKDALDSYVTDETTSPVKIVSNAEALSIKDNTAKLSIIKGDDILAHINEGKFVADEDSQKRIGSMIYGIRSVDDGFQFRFPYSFRISSKNKETGEVTLGKRYKLESINRYNVGDNSITVITVEDYINDIINTGGINNYGYSANYVQDVITTGDPAITGGGLGYSIKKTIKLHDFKKDSLDKPDTTVMPVTEVENNLEISDNNGIFVESQEIEDMSQVDKNIEMYKEIKEDADPFAGYSEPTGMNLDNFPDPSDWKDANGLPLC